MIVEGEEDLEGIEIEYQEIKEIFLPDENKKKDLLKEEIIQKEERGARVKEKILAIIQKITPKHQEAEKEVREVEMEENIIQTEGRVVKKEEGATMKIQKITPKHQEAEREGKGKVLQGQGIDVKNLTTGLRLNDIFDKL